MHKIIEILNKILKREKSLPYSKLSPKSDIEDKEKYFEALKWAIDNKEMHNIAITGPYGSGKSSIINSFFKKNKRIKKLSISMASFNGEKMTKEEIEKSILQQLSYKVKDKKIHYSRFKKINNEKEINITGRIIGGCIDILSEIFGTKFDYTKEFLEKYKEDGIIWCFDNCELSKEQLIRTLWKLNELEYFNYSKAIIFGRCGNDNTYLNYDMESCIKDSVISKLDIPIIYDADISHKGPSMTIINGAIVNITYSDGKGEVEFEIR